MPSALHSLGIFSLPPHVSSAAYNKYSYEEVEEDMLVPATGRRQRVVRYEVTPSKNKRVVFPLQEEEKEDSDDDARGPTEGIFQTPSKSARVWDFNTPSKPASSGRGGVATAGASKARIETVMPGRIAATPIKAPTLSAATSTPVKQSVLVVGTPVRSPSLQQKHPETQRSEHGVADAEDAREKSIYDALGWNDDFSD